MILRDLPDAQYYTMEGISASALKIFIENPMYYYNKYILDACPFTSDSLMFGRALHHYFLQNETFSEYFIVKPENMNLTTKEGKEWKLEAGIREIVSEKDFKSIKILSDNCKKKIPDEWLKKASCELALTTTMKEDLTLKGKVDMLIELDDRCINLDIKTTQSLYDHKIRYAINDYMYYVQGVIYRRLISDNYCWKPVETYLLFCDKNTLDCRMVNIDNIIESNFDWVMQKVEELHHAKVTKQFKSIYDEVLVL